MSTTKYQWSFCTASILPHHGRMKAALMRRVERHPSCTSCSLRGWRHTLELLGLTSCQPSVSSIHTETHFITRAASGREAHGIILHGGIILKASILLWLWPSAAWNPAKYKLWKTIYLYFEYSRVLKNNVFLIETTICKLKSPLSKRHNTYEINTLFKRDHQHKRSSSRFCFLLKSLLCNKASPWSTHSSPTKKTTHDIRINLCCNLCSVLIIKYY